MRLSVVNGGVNNPSLAALLTAECVKPKVPIEVALQQKDTSLQTDNGQSFNTVAGICRYLARVASDCRLYGEGGLQQTEVDHWIDFSLGRLSCVQDFNDAVLYLDHVLGPVAYLVGHSVTLADIFVWTSLRCSAQWQKLSSQKDVPTNVMRYFRFLSEQPQFQEVDKHAPKQQAQHDRQDSKKGKKEEGGKFVELPGAEMGKLIVRFPPEASGYLHVGHAKAALLNQYYQQTFQGKLIMRFDDTNPAKENEHFEEVILQDLEMLGIKPDIFTHTSDHFDRILALGEQLLRESKAYVDDTDPETMKKEREERTDSKNRSNSVEKNLATWEEMKQGTTHGQLCAVRAKIDMNSDNGCMRDPTIFRCKTEAHVKTGTKYKVYPTYDFACPIVDSLENVTHALRTTEYHDRDDQYYWFIDALGLRKPHIWEYSRLNLQNTVMSKRKLAWLVDQGVVNGWDDPRFPTVRGVLRRGMTVEGLKQFVIAQGSSRSVNMMEWDKIWAFNKKVIDPIVPRYTALLEEGVVPVTVHGAKEESTTAQKHPKDASIGEKTVWYNSRVLVDGADAALLSVGETVTFINWGNLVVKAVHKDNDGNVTAVDADLNLENKDYKKTTKLTWLADTNKAPLIPAVCVTYDNIISKAVLAKDDDFKQYVNMNSKMELQMLGDPELANLKKGDMIQLQRRGYFICDSPYEPPSRHSGRASPCVLLNIPDGHTKDMPTAGSKHKESSAKEKAQSKKGKAAEKSPQEERPPSQPFTGGVDVCLLHQKVADQGSKVRQMKGEKAAKSEVDAEVKILLQLKADYKAATGKDWKLEKVPSNTPPQPQGGANSGKAEELNSQITTQGDKIRQLKSSKADKALVDAEVKILLQLKADYKAATGKDWKPGSVSSKAPTQPQGGATGSGDSAQIEAVNCKIAAQGDKVRQLKAAKASKGEIDAEVKVLLQLKADYKNLTGKDWKPGAVPEKKEDDKAMASGAQAEELKTRIDAQGEKVRQLKASKADKAEIDTEVKTLLALKAEYKDLTGEDLGGGGGKKGKKANKENRDKDKQNKEKQAAVKADDAAGSREVKKVSRLGLEAKKEENLPEWYSQVITKSEMIEYYDVSGCYVLRPWSFGIWEQIQKWFDEQIKEAGFENVYFPIFVSNAALQKEKEHIEDFAPEVAWVTKSGETQLAEPIAIRPTSETVMYPAYAKWVQSHRDLPIKLNQWCNVVRWEFKHPQPFLRTREFLWQEGHSAYATYEEACQEVHFIIDLYEHIYEKMLAIPVVKGKKTQKEKFAGGDFTTTVEAYISASGRGIQAATSHHLGQNFSKMFEITFEDPETKEKRFAYQNSWAITTRSIGVLVMVHGDNKGLVLPPNIATVQVIVVPCGITANLSDADRKALMDKCEEVSKALKAAGIKSRADLRDNYSPGWKFNHWELKGVPVRLELGPRDLKDNQAVAVRRDTGDKVTLPLDGLAGKLNELLKTIQDSLYAKAKKDLDSNQEMCHTFDEFCGALDKQKMILAPFCGDIPCEDQVKKLSARDAVVEEGAPAMGAKGLCIPFNQPADIKDDTKCICPGCSKKPKFYTLFGRSY